MHGLCSGRIIHIDRLTILMADHSACHQIVALHTNIKNWMYTRRETWVYRGNSAGNRVENGHGQINGQSWQNHILFGKGKKRCDFRWEWTKNRLPTGKPWSVKHRQVLSIRPSICSHCKGVCDRNHFMFLTRGEYRRGLSLSLTEVG